ncbi:hypothetical protein B0T11DRAFT_294560 [Plectosphaerella cucumerina]|uniref:Uncharacterized protein n=1 Tax=Plectosphaerella cucumerina TaxID=40658 RepID=A0A8K0TWL4_9PEZI|nr:hypothetical protein B0T11DRAFT_294560 [Plectosphaerella cucumerina]
MEPPPFDWAGTAVVIGFTRCKQMASDLPCLTARVARGLIGGPPPWCNAEARRRRPTMSGSLLLITVPISPAKEGEKAPPDLLGVAAEKDGLLGAAIGHFACHEWSDPVDPSQNGSILQRRRDAAPVCAGVTGVVQVGRILELSLGMPGPAGLYVGMLDGVDCRVVSRTRSSAWTEASALPAEARARSDNYRTVRNGIVSSSLSVLVPIGDATSSVIDAAASHALPSGVTATVMLSTLSLDKSWVYDAKGAGFLRIAG